MSLKYKLDENHNLIPVHDLLEWGEWFETADRRVGYDKNDKFTVSTVFLGVDHNWGESRPALFELMVFEGGDMGGIEQERYSTWDEAARAHEVYCKLYGLREPPERTHAPATAARKVRL